MEAKIKQWKSPKKPKEWCHHDNKTNINLIELSEANIINNRFNLTVTLDNSIKFVSNVEIDLKETRIRLEFVP